MVLGSDLAVCTEKFCSHSAFGPASYRHVRMKPDPFNNKIGWKLQASRNFVVVFVILRVTNFIHLLVVTTFTLLKDELYLTYTACTIIADLWASVS